MEKEEFPTFLNQQPTVVFGRTGRELLIIVCGIVSGYSLWSGMHTLLQSPWWIVVCLLLSVLPVLISLVVALVPVAGRPLEEWVMCWFLYTCMPRLFLYEPEEEDMEGAEEQERQGRATRKNNILDATFDED